MSDLITIDNAEGMRALMARKLAQLQSAQVAVCIEDAPAVVPAPDVGGVEDDSLYTKSVISPTHVMAKPIDSFEAEVAAFESTLPTPTRINDIVLDNLSHQFSEHVHDNVHDKEKCVKKYTHLADAEHEHCEREQEQTPRQKIAAGRALQAEGRAEMSNGIYLSSDQLSEVFTVFMNSLNTDYPMQPFDAVAAVHPWEGHMLTKRSNEHQLKLLRAELQKHLSHPVISSIVECPHLGKEMLDGCAAPSIGATLNQLHRYYKIAKYMQESDAKHEQAARRIQQLEQALLLNGVNVNTENAPLIRTARPTPKALPPEIIVGIQSMPGTVRNVAKHYGVSVGVVSKYRNATASPAGTNEETV